MRINETNINNIDVCVCVIQNEHLQNVQEWSFSINKIYVVQQRKIFFFCFLFFLAFQQQ